MAQEASVDADTALQIIWVLVGLTFFFVLLRLYTRIRITGSYGCDDHFYNVAFVCFVLYTSLIQISKEHGLGMTSPDPRSPSDEARAILSQTIGYTFLVIGNISSKLSVGFFLKRVISGLGDAFKIQLAIWIPMILFATSAIAALLVSWFACQPAAYLWDKSINGECNINPIVSGLLGGSLSVFVDVWYVVLTWYIMWPLNMPRRRKLVTLFSMSLGVVAAICGTKRVIELERLGNKSFLKDSIELIIWHGAEISVTLIAVGIPICFFPLYYSTLRRLVEHGHLPDVRRWPRAMNRRSKTYPFGTSTIGGTPYYAVTQKPCNRTNTATETDLGENIIAIYGRNSSYHGLRGHDSKELKRSRSGRWSGVRKPQDKRNTWASQDDVVDGAIVVRKEVRVRTQVQE